MSTARNRLAVVICTYNRSASLIETLSSLYACGYTGEERVDIVVVANNCSDDTLARLELPYTHIPGTVPGRHAFVQR